MKRRGFTMLEVLTVVVIIVILGGMLLAGSKYIINNGKTNTTRTMLGDLKAMMTERETAVGATKNNSDINAIFPAGTPQPPLAAPGAVDEGMAARTPSAGNAVALTQSVMSVLMAVPANKQMVTKIPSQQFLETIMGGTPVLMDGFNYPIIAVPSTGLSGVTINGMTNQTIIAPDGKPFFASPGPDGDFSKGDDNVYSFKQ